MAKKKRVNSQKLKVTMMSVMILATLYFFVKDPQIQNTIIYTIGAVALGFQGSNVLKSYKNPSYTLEGEVEETNEDKLDKSPQ